MSLPPSVAAKQRDALTGPALPHLRPPSFQQGGFGSLLVERYQRRADVINRGFSGYTTAFLLPVFDAIMGGTLHAAGSPLLVTIFLGANDAAIDDRNVPIEAYKQNLIKLVALVRQARPDAHVLLLTPPPLEESMWRASRAALGSPVGYSAEQTDRYVAAARDAASGLDGCTLVDVHAAVRGGGPATELMSDGLHLSTAGNAVVFRAVVDAIEAHVPAFSLERLPCCLPHWSQCPTALAARGRTPEAAPSA